MRNSSSLDWLRFMHTPNDYRVSQKVSLTEPGIEELIKWLHYVPVKNITKSVEHIIKDIKSKKGDFYSFDFDSSVFDRQLKDL